ncbi:MAG: 50S ribosomal protein L2 [Conexivisphaerales archaeon]
MGKRILVRRRGKAGLQWLAPKRGKISPVSYPSIDSSLTMGATVAAILHERGRAAPLAKLQLDNGTTCWIPAVSGLEQGQRITIGPMAPPSTGNILPLSRIPEGTSVCNIEAHYGDGGKYVRVAGSSAIVFSQSGAKTVVKFPSGRSLFIDSSARATVGIVAGGGRVEKPFLKAGNRLKYMRARGKAYPKVRGVAMAVVHHPFGGGRHQHPGKSTSTARMTPPGRKVGHIAPKRTGRGRAARQQQQQQQQQAK